MKKNILFLLSFQFITLYSFAQWTAIGNGFDGDVNAVCVFNNALYAAGNFTHDGTSATTLNHIAKWNGSAWVAVGTGVNANVTSMAVFNSELYVGGDFTTAGTASALKIAKWSGTTWYSVDSGFNNTVRCLYVWNNTLYAGGTFNASGSSSIIRIAKFTGTEWQTAGPAPGPVNAIVGYNNELYIGGYWFPPYVCKFNAANNAWDDLTGGSIAPDDEVTSLAFFRKQNSSNIVLWIGGKFNMLSSPHLCTWSSTGGFTTSFNTFNQTAGANVNTLLSTSNYLFAGGGFSATVMGNSFSKLGKYNGSSIWDSVGVSFNNDVNALTSFNGNLVAGGKFTSLGSAGNANRIAWRNLSIGIDEVDENILVRDFYPNPLLTSAVLKIQTKSSFHQPALNIFDLDGRKVNPVTKIISLNPVNHEVEYKIERSGLPAGIYFYEISDLEKNIAAGKFIVE